MKKLKEVWVEIVDGFCWESFIFSFCLALALATFLLGIVLSLVSGNLAYVLLWFVSIVSLAFAIGVEG